MKSLRFMFVLVAFVLSTVAFAGERYPVGPNPNITPGSLCTGSSKRRYQEQITVCERDVSTSLKRDIIRQYDDELGFSIHEMDRMEFKIDHFIPLSVGGSNNRDNLWPQHRTVYELTDPIETVLHIKMEQSRITQEEAIRVIREAKLNLDRAPELLEYVEGL